MRVRTEQQSADFGKIKCFRPKCQYRNVTGFRICKARKAVVCLNRMDDTPSNGSTNGETAVCSLGGKRANSNQTDLLCEIVGFHSGWT